MSVFLKRIIITFVCLSVFFIAAVYFFLPDAFTAYSSAAIGCNTPAAGRTINTKWKNIFAQHSDTSFYINGYTYTIQAPLYNGASIRVSKDDNTYATKLLLIPISPDSTLLQWNTNIESVSNPFTKIFAYRNMQGLESSMHNATTLIQSYLEKSSNVYRYNIRHTTLTDTVLMFTKKKSATYPATTDIYLLVDKLKKYIAQQGATETNSPMLNVVHTDTGYVTMVGIPVNKQIPPEGDIIPRFLRPMKDKILTTEVHGGLATIRDAYCQIKQYMQDHSMSPPVIPFELMITDRSRQTDTTKWKTQIFYPII